MRKPIPRILPSINTCSNETEVTFLSEGSKTKEITLPSSHETIINSKSEKAQLLQSLQPPGVSTIQQNVHLVNYIRSTGVSNVLAARVPINTRHNIQLMFQLATSVSDRHTVNCLLYGWPLNHDGSATTCTFGNHSSALKYAGHMDQYIRAEMDHQALLGPFITLPWSDQVAVSPMSTTPKKGTFKRRTIMDLSWPKTGASVNSGIDKNKYMEQVIAIQYPTVDRLCKRAAQLGPGAKGWKRDLNRAFKQWNTCPKDWPLLGIFWRNLLFFDKTTCMGSRSACYICQSITNFIRHIMENLQYFVLNYVDDFMGLEEENKAMEAYIALGNLLRDLRLDESPDKAVPPTEVIEFLGIQFNLKKMVISVTPQKLADILRELQKWQ